MVLLAAKRFLEFEVEHGVEPTFADPLAEKTLPVKAEGFSPPG
jgi:hypothetical protein